MRALSGVAARRSQTRQRGMIRSLQGKTATEIAEQLDVNKATGLPHAAPREEKVITRGR